MPDTPTLMAFVGASLMLLVIPGPTLMYIVARGIHQGRSAALVSTLGVEIGTLLQLLIVTAGLSALFVSSELALSTLKHLGALYLIWLGVDTLLDAGHRFAGSARSPAKLRAIFFQGILVEVLNPKTALFFLAFLPQFADPARGPVDLQILMLGSIFILLAICNDGVIGLLSGTLGERLSGANHLLMTQRYAGGGVYLLLAALMGVS